MWGLRLTFVITDIAVVPSKSGQPRNITGSTAKHAVVSEAVQAPNKMNQDESDLAE